MAEASTTPKIVEEITHVRTGPFAVNYQSAEFIAGVGSGELIAAPTRPNSATYITHVSMGVVKGGQGNIIYDADITLVDGGGDEMFGPVSLEANGQTTFSKDFTKPMKVTDNKALDFQGHCAESEYYQSTCWIFVEYYTGDAPIG